MARSFGQTVTIGAIDAIDAIDAIGTIGTSDIAVGGSTTISAAVPPGIAVGAYDLIVTNTDSQAASVPLKTADCGWWR